MAIRMQQRRGTAQQWTDANPILSSGEIGFETDTGQFKMGNGISTWSALSYFKDLNDLGSSLNNYIPITEKGQPLGVATLDLDGHVYAEQLTYVDDQLDAHASSHLQVHGIANTADLATKDYSDGALGAHNLDTTNVHGIEDTGALATKAYADGAVSTHNSDTTDVHGIADTNALATKTYADGAAASAVGSHTLDTTDIHGIADTADLVLTNDSRLSDTRTPTDNTVSTDKIVNLAVTDAKLAADAVTTAKILDGAVTSAKIADGTIVNADINASAAIAQSKIDGLSTSLAAKADLASPTFTGTVSGITKTMVGLGNVDNTSDANKPVSTATQTALDLKAPKANPTFTGTVNAADLTLSGNLTVNGTTTTVSSTNLEITDPLIYIGTGNSANANDLGVVGHFDNGTYQHTGIVRDATDGKWKLFSGVTTEPSGTIDFTTWTKDALVVGALEATTVTPSSGVVFTDGTQTKEGVPSRTTIQQKTASYTLSALTERDNFIEVNSASATTISIPTDASVNFPIGTSIDILQTGAGQVTIAAVTPGTTTVNGTPGLKLRTQWSSATLFKRAANLWVVMGDLSA